MTDAERNMRIELWAGAALDTLLTAYGIKLSDVKYRVIKDSWDGDVRTVLEIEPVITMRYSTMVGSEDDLIRALEHITRKRKPGGST